MNNPAIMTPMESSPLEAPPAYSAVVVSERASVHSSNASQQVSTTHPEQLAIPATLTPVTNLEYDPRLSSFDITPSAWASFAHELYRAASPTTAQKTLAWAVGGGSCLIAPGTGRLVRFAIWRSMVKNNVNTALSTPDDNVSGGIQAVLLRYGERWSAQLEIEVLENEEAKAMMDTEASNANKTCMDGCQYRVQGCGNQDQFAFRRGCGNRAMYGCQRGCGSGCAKRCHRSRACHGKQTCGSFFRRPLFRIVVSRTGLVAPHVGPLDMKSNWQQCNNEIEKREL